VRGIISYELKQKEDEFLLPDYERVADSERFHLSAEPFVVGQSEPTQSLSSFGAASKGVFNLRNK
jgi:hypothetical protein